MVTGAQGAITQHGNVAVQENFEMKADTVNWTLALFTWLHVALYDSNLVVGVCSS